MTERWEECWRENHPILARKLKPILERKLPHSGELKLPFAIKSDVLGVRIGERMILQ